MPAAGWVLALSLVLGGALPARSGTIEGRIRPSGNADVSGYVVSVDDISGSFPPPTAHAVIDQKSLQFRPHVLAVLAGTTVDFPNSDAVLHNVFSISPGSRFNLGLYGQGKSRSIRFDEPGLIELLCNVHQEMSAYVVVLTNPYFAVTAADGSFQIPNVPPGMHRLRYWHERRTDRLISVTVPAQGLVSARILTDMPSEAAARPRRRTNRAAVREE